jgi:hypothetical protein
MANHPRRVQLRKTKGWRKPPITKWVTGSTRWGNPFKTRKKTIEEHGRVVAEYRSWLLAPAQADFRQLVRKHLRGFNLACFCPEEWPCHADVLLELANAKDG